MAILAEWNACIRSRLWARALREEMEELTSYSARHIIVRNRVYIYISYLQMAAALSFTYGDCRHQPIDYR
jgi:hypothetical protein